MSGPSMIERIVKAARLKGGERLELSGDAAPVLISGGTRLQAGNAVIAPQELEQWLESLVGPERWVSMELGAEVEAPATVAGAAVLVRAKRVEGVPHVSIDLKPPAHERPASVAARPAESGPPGPGSARAAPLARPLDRMLQRVVELGGSDLHLTSSLPPMARIHGDLQPLQDFPAALSSEHILLMCEEIAPAAQRKAFRDGGDADLAYGVPGVARFRASLFRENRGVGATFRRIPDSIRSFDELGLPECVKSLCLLARGLVLVAGPAGSGKSTTLAAIVDYVNTTRSGHIVTVEDPIEVVHENKRSLVHQREVHRDTQSFARALRAALHEDPDVMVVGDVGAPETVSLVLEAADSGFLVFGTLPTATAVSTVDRLIDLLPADRRAEIRTVLADALKGVVAQTLVKRSGGGRVAAYEILLGVPQVANLIREGRTGEIPALMQAGRRLGMRTLNDSLAELVRSGRVEVGEALARTVDREGLGALLKPE